MNDIREFAFFIFLDLIPKLLVIAVVIILMGGGCYGLWLIGAFNGVQLPDSQDIYESAYNRCIARETLSDTQCHDIALKEAYPDD